MNVASPELCKELYELSGWSDCTAYWNTSDEGPFLTDILDPEDSPAYDLGYLLRKLPNWVPNDDNGGSYYFDLHFVPHAGGGDWTACYDNALEQTYKHDGWADTPEDAAAELAIELFKQGVLTRDGDE